MGQSQKSAGTGGDAASPANGTGVMVDEQLYSKVKTSLESLQIHKTDIEATAYLKSLLDSDSKFVIDSDGKYVKIANTVNANYTSAYTGAQIDTFIGAVI